jgi:RNA polymerase sigma factor (sigma-70 family)
MDDGQRFEQIHAPLRRFASVVAPPDVEPDDLIQEALARTLRRTTLGELDDPLVYLRRVVLNLASNHRRQFSRRAAIRARRLHNETTVHDDYSSDVEELLLVPSDQRAVLYLHLVEGLPHDAVAELLDITPEASRARLSRGLRHLRVALEDDQEAAR